MKLETINGIRVITPNNNMWLCNENDKVISDRIYLCINADEATWHEITGSEKTRLEELWNEPHSKDGEATEADYLNSLEEPGATQ